MGALASPQLETASSAPPPADGWQLLKSRDFGLLWAGQVVSQVGDGLNKVALLWFVYSLTGSALKMTIIGLLQTVPPLVCGPLIGVYLDRLPKKAVMIWVDLIRFVMILLIPGLYAFDALSLERLYVLVFITAIVSTIFGPALASSVPLLVRRDQLTQANALIQSTANLGILLGPAISGVGIALIGAQNVLYVDAATFLVSALCLMPMRLRDSSSPSVSARPSFVQDLLVGFRFVFVQQRTIFALMIASVLFSLGASAFVFVLPLVATDLLNIGPVEMGGLWSALGLGMLVASAGLAWMRQGGLQDRLRLVAGALAVGGVVTCILPQLDTPLLASAFVMVIGGSTALFTPVVWALLQELTPEHLLGRVFTTFSTGGMSSAMIGMLGVGWAADEYGPAASIVTIGLMLLATAAVTIAFSRHYAGCAAVPAQG